MQLHMKIKMLRVFSGTTQKALADLIGTDQETLAHIEKFRRKKINPQSVATMAQYFGVSESWLLANIGPMNENGWLFWRLPPEGTRYGRQFNQVTATLNETLGELLRENSVKEYSRTMIEGTISEVLFIFRITDKSSLIIHANFEVLPIIDQVIESAGKTLKRIKVKSEIQIDLLNEIPANSNHNNLAAAIELHKIMGFGKIAETWHPSWFKNIRENYKQKMHAAHVRIVWEYMKKNNVTLNDLRKMMEKEKPFKN